MRNWYDTGCDCNNPEPIVGAIVGGKKFPFGTVKKSDYDADMEDVNDAIDANTASITALESKHDSEVAVINTNITTLGNSIAAVNASKVSAVPGKGLSTNDYTTLEQTKLAGIEAGANKTVVDYTLAGNSVNPISNKAVYDALATKATSSDLNTTNSNVSALQSGKVDKVDGKGLSTNDYSNAEKNKLDVAASDVVTIKSYFTAVTV